MSILESTRKMTTNEKMCYDMGYAQGKQDAVPVVRGEWKRTRDENGNALFAECSNCHRRIETVYQETKYCHSCGAKMESEGST